MSEDAYNEDSLWRRLRFTPMRDWLRGRLTGRLDWQTHIDEADLPVPAREVVRRVVKKSRLWRLEKADVADELIAHFMDGLEALEVGREVNPLVPRESPPPTPPGGRGAGEAAGAHPTDTHPPDTRTFATAQERREEMRSRERVAVRELIAEFGDETQAARLIRRAKKRNRPIVWKMMKRSLQAVGVLIVLYFAAAGWFAMGKPDISVNYLAKVNAPAKAVPQDERAWPIYREALLKYGLPTIQSDQLYVKEKDGGSRLARPTDAQWPKAVAFLQQHQDLLNLIREGASKPRIGLVSKFSLEAYSPRDQRALKGPASKGSSYSSPAVNASSEAWKSHSLSGALLPQLRILRSMARLTAADLELAATRSDAARAMADFDAIFGLADQAREAPYLISQLVANSILDGVGFKQLADILAHRPALFSNQQLVHLAHRLASLDKLVDLRLKDENYFLLDTFQRIYDKSGHITANGLRLLPQFMFPMSSPCGPPVWGFHVQLGPVSPVALLPLAHWLVADRAEMTRQLRRLTTMNEAYVRLPLWVELHSDSGVQRILRQWKKSPLLSMRYRPLVILYPAMDSTARSMKEEAAVRDALEVVIALELYKRDHGAYPDTLAALVPRYVPKPPIDYSTGKPLLYKVVNGQPLLYGRGLDGDDDGGVPGKTQKFTGWSPVPDQGDWVLYPRVVE